MTHPAKKPYWLRDLPCDDKDLREFLAGIDETHLEWARQNMADEMRAKLIEPGW